MKTKLIFYPENEIGNSEIVFAVFGKTDVTENFEFENPNDAATALALCAKLIAAILSNIEEDAK